MQDRNPRGDAFETEIYAFGPFRLSLSRQLLLRGGVPVHIGARALDILGLLLRRAGTVVAKAELLHYAWPTTFVDESNLKVNISMLRRVLSGGASDITYIATVAGRGYKFVAPVEIEAMSVGPTQFATFPGRPLAIGRAVDLARLAEALPRARCLTIVGAGGVGKTTVAVAAAYQASQHYPHGLAFADLSTIGDSRYAAAAIALSVGARQSYDHSLSGIVEALHGRKILLVLDNCEHMLSTVASIADHLLGALPETTILATSREPLRLAAELVQVLPPLEVPGDHRDLSVEQALDYPSVQLFVARSRERGDYALAPADAPLVAAICRRLDGIPLAIELAASKTLAFGALAMLDMLGESFRLLGNGPRDAPPRQQTLQATLDWSYRLLSEDEATLFRHLSVFAGAFRLDDAVAMAEQASLDPPRAIGALERLAARSLVATDYQSGALRYRLLETTRAYAAERLVDGGEHDGAMRRYAGHVLAIFEQADREWTHREKRSWMEQYAGRIADLRKVLTWAFEPAGDERLGIGLTAAAIPLWDELSAVSEARHWVDAALRAVAGNQSLPIDVRMKLAASRASSLNFGRILHPEAEQAWLDCHDLGKEAGRLDYQLRGLWGLAIYLIFTGRPGEAITRMGQFMPIAQALGDVTASAEGERTLATAEIYVGKLDGARRRLELLAERFREPKDAARIARFQLDRFVAIQCALAFLHWVRGEPEQAARAAEDALARGQAIGHIVSQSNALALGALPVAVWSGDLDAAERYHAMLEANGRHEDIPVWVPVRRFFEGAIRAKRGEPDGARQMRLRLEELVAGRFVMRTPMYYSMLAEVLLGEGSLEEAADAVRIAKARLAEQGEIWCLAEVLRLEALVRREAGERDAAEELLRQAVEQARAIGARAFERRAASSLAALSGPVRHLPRPSGIVHSNG